MKGNSVIALGFFDGVHLGHAGLLKCCRARADALGLRAAVMTFDLHPDTLVTGKPVPLLNSREDREDIFRRLFGMDDVIFYHFTEETMHMPWQSFLEDYVIGELGAAHVVCGHDFHFGDRGAGNPERLMTRCQELGVGCDVIPKITLDGITVSSTYIRQLVAAGEMEQANRFLGHPHLLSGQVVPGAKVGRTIGIPTANLRVPAGVLEPAHGVYATKVYVDGMEHLAVTNVGTRPTVHGDGVTVEPWILDFSDELYGKTIRVEFYKRLREERKFDSLDALRAEILHNADQTREYFAAQA